MKKTLSLGYLSLLVTVFGNLLILPIAYRYLSSSQVALWFNYLALYSLILLLDFGITTATARAFSQAWGKRVEDTVTNILRPDYERFAALYRTSQSIYSKVALLGLILAISVATPYLLIIAEKNSDYWDIWYSWPIYCASLYLALKQLYLVPALRGMDKIDLVYKANIAGKTVQVTVTILLLIAGCGITAISLGFMLSTLASRILLGRFFNSEVGSLKIRFDLCDKNNNDMDIRQSMVPKVFKQGIISLSNFFQDKAALFYVSAFCGLDASSRYGLTVQIMGLVAALSNVYYNSIQSKLIEFNIQGSKGKIRKYFTRAATIQIFMIAVGGVTLMIFGNSILDAFGMSKAIVDHQTLGVIVFYLVVFNFQLICANSLLIRDDYSMMWPYLLSAVVFMLALTVANAFITLTPLNVMLIQLLVMLAYNAWKWPSKVKRIMRIESQTL